MKKDVNNNKLSSFLTRCVQGTPPFFKKLRVVGLVIAAAGTTILATDIALPEMVISIGGYLVVAGSVITAMSQAAITEYSDVEE